MPDRRFDINPTSPSLNAPAVSILEITPSDTEDLSEIVKALNVTTPGAVRVTTLDDTVSDIEISAGIELPILVKRVWETGTTATGIRGLI